MAENDFTPDDCPPNIGSPRDHTPGAAEAFVDPVASLSEDPGCTPGCAEGDRETIEEDLRLQQQRQGANAPKGS